MAVAATIVEVPTPLIVSIAVCLIGIWVTMCIFGFNCNEFCLCIVPSLLWPIWWTICGITTFFDWLQEVGLCNDKDITKRCVARVMNIVDIVTLPLRPFAFGKMMKSRFAKKGKD